MKKRGEQQAAASRDQLKQIDAQQRAREQLRHEVRAFERLLQEFRAAADASLLAQRKELAQALFRVEAEQEAQRRSCAQLKAMTRNSTRSFTELARRIAQFEEAAARLAGQVAPVAALAEQSAATELYLHKYQPLEIYNCVHAALTAALQSAPTQTRLDLVAHSARRIAALAEKSRNVGSVKEEPFVKNFAEVLSLDEELAALAEQRAEELRAAEEADRVALEKKQAKKSKQEAFEGMLFGAANFEKLQEKLWAAMDPRVDQLFSDRLKNSPEVAKLNELYAQQYREQSESESEQDSRSHNAARYYAPAASAPEEGRALSDALRRSEADISSSGSADDVAGRDRSSSASPAPSRQSEKQGAQGACDFSSISPSLQADDAGGDNCDRRDGEASVDRTERSSAVNLQQTGQRSPMTQLAGESDRKSTQQSRVSGSQARPSQS